MGTMQSYHWSEQNTTPAEDNPVLEPQSTGDYLLAAHEQVGDRDTDQQMEVSSDEHRNHSDSRGEGVENRAQVTGPQRLVSVLDNRVARRPLQVRRRNRRFSCRPRRLAVNEEDEEEEAKDSNRDTVRIHGLSVQRYRELYHSVLTPAALSGLNTNNPAEYMAQVLELKQRLYAALYRPQLKEAVGEDGQVTITETFDLT